MKKSQTSVINHRIIKANYDCLLCPNSAKHPIISGHLLNVRAVKRTCDPLVLYLGPAGGGGGGGEDSQMEQTVMLVGNFQFNP